MSDHEASNQAHPAPAVDETAVERLSRDTESIAASCDSYLDSLNAHSLLVHSMCAHMKKASDYTVQLCRANKEANLRAASSEAFQKKATEVMAREADMQAREAAAKTTEERLSHLQKTLATRETCLNEREAAARATEERQGHHQKTLSSREDAVRQREAAAKTSKERIGYLQQNLTSNEAAVKQREAAAKTLQDRLGQLEKTLTARESAVKVTEERLGQLEKTLTARESAVKDAEARLGQLEKTLTLRESAVKDAEARLGQLEKTLTLRESTVKDAEARLGQLQQTLTSHEAAVKQREVAAKTLQDHLSQLEKTLTPRESAVKDTEARLGQLEKTLTARESAVKDTEEHISHLKRAIVAREATVQDRESDLAKAQDNLHKAQADLAKKQASLAGLDARACDLKKRELAQAAIDETNRKTKRAQENKAEKLEEWENELERQKEYNEEQKKFMAQREEELYRTKINLQDQQKDLDSRLSQLAQDKQALQPELDRLAGQREEIQAMQAQLHEQKRVLDRRWGDKADVLAAVDPYLPPDLRSAPSDGKLRFPTATEAQLKKEVHEAMAKSRDAIVSLITSWQDKLDTQQAPPDVVCLPPPPPLVPQFTETYMFQIASSAMSHSCCVRQERSPVDDAMAKTATSIVVCDGVGEGGESSGVFARLLVNSVAGHIRQLSPSVYAASDAQSLPQLLREGTRSVISSEEQRRDMIESRASTTLSAVSLFPVKEGFGVSCVEIGDSQICVVVKSRASGRWKYYPKNHHRRSGNNCPLQVGAYDSVDSVMEKFPEVSSHLTIPWEDDSAPVAVVICGSDGLWDNIGTAPNPPNEHEKMSVIEGICNMSDVFSDHSEDAAQNRQTATAVIGGALRDHVASTLASKDPRRFKKPDDVSFTVAQIGTSALDKIDFARPTGYSHVFCHERVVPDAVRQGIELHDHTRITPFLQGVVRPEPLEAEPAFGNFFTNKYRAGWKDRKCWHKVCRHGRYCLDAHDGELRCPGYTKYGFCMRPTCDLLHDAPRDENIGYVLCKFTEKKQRERGGGKRSRDADGTRRVDDEKRLRHS